MDFSNSALIRGVTRGDHRSVSRLITLVENRAKRIRAAQRALFPRTGRAHVVGVTGSPGAGKSTLVDQLARGFRHLGSRVAILAIDPSSPFSGGAILGDRIRMMRAEEEGGIFIRSMATRGSLGGIARATLEAVQVLDAAGFDLILVETVGVGQAEVDIVKAAHTTLVVLVPGMGDSVQAIKAGILEIGDLFVINKADREGADILHRDLRLMLSLAEEESNAAWKPEILHTVATKGEGTTKLIAQIQRHHSWVVESKQGHIRAQSMMESTIKSFVSDELSDRYLSDSKLIATLAKRCLLRKLDPRSAAKRLIGKIK